MANLIPPDAKRAVIIEYWLRVVTVWFVIVGLSFVVVALLMAPTFVLVQSQLRAFSNAYDDALVREETFESAKQTITDANELSLLLAHHPTSKPLSEVVSILDDIAGRNVTINQFTFTRSGSVLETITVVGVADTRSALANFSKDIEAHELFVEAELPISNLAKDKDIVFNIDITPAPQ